MASFCQNGLSQPKFGTSAVTDVGAAYIAELITRAPSVWLIPAIGVLAITPLVMSTFCQNDPPAEPTFTQAETDAILNIKLGPDFVSGVQKFTNYILRRVWFDLCQCTTGTTPAVGPPNPPPAGTQIIQLPVPSTLRICQSSGIITSPVTAGSFAISDSFTTVPPCLDANHTFSDLQLVRLHIKRTPVGAGPHDVTQVQSTLGVCAGPVIDLTITGTLTFPADDTWRTFDSILVSPYTGVGEWNIILPNTSTDTFSSWYEVYCGPPNTNPGCCPPDPLTLTLIQHILDQVNQIQRFEVPFAYVKAASVAGLTGSGTITIQRAIGVQIQITSSPPTNTTLPGTPPYVFDLGWCSFIETDGMIEEKRVAQTNLTWFPRLAPLANQIGYFFSPGVTATITPLLPEAPP